MRRPTLAAFAALPVVLVCHVASAQEAESPTARVYGFLRPVANFSVGALESFSQANASAPTAAGNEAYALNPTDSRLTMQVAQSRIGLWIHEQAPVRGHLEFDFIDFTRSTPTVASLPRVRIAAIEWLASERVTFVAGQDWDLVQPIMPHGLNFVGGLFQAGNTGFMRQQARVLVTDGDIEYGVALAMPGVNASARDGSLELASLPMGELRVQLGLGAAGRVGASAFAAPLVFRAGASDEARTIAALAGVYGDVTFAGVNARFEGYAAQNGANTAALSLAQARAAAGTNTVDVREAGGYLSVKGALDDAFALYAQGGFAAVLNAEDVAASYGYAGTVDAANPPAVGSGVLTSTGPGLRWNLATRAGIEWKAHPQLVFAAEGFFYRSRFTLQRIDEDRVRPIAQAVGGEIGAVYTF